MWPQGPDHYKPKEHNLNKLGRGPQGDATYKYQGCRPYSFRQEGFFTLFPILADVKHDP